MKFVGEIADPIHNFIRFTELEKKIIDSSVFQRLRRIKQLAGAHLVYPAAQHSRFEHSLGTMHLAGLAGDHLYSIGAIDKDSIQELRIASLLHDVGHGPFSHALESVLIENVNHEQLSLLIMKKLNVEYKGALTVAIDIFTDVYPKKFLHQLVSGQLDVDRMDYLTRDSFFTGVSEGVVGYDRILKMLTVHDGELMVEEKAIYSIEKFLVARRLMYWQVYLHKTVLVSEMMLVKIFQRVRELGQAGDLSVVTDSPLSAFLLGDVSDDMADNLDLFCMLDDTDVVSSIKKWSLNKDRVLSYLSKSILNRKLLKIRLQTAPIPEDELSARKIDACQKAGVDIMESAYLAFTGEAVNSLYNPFDERINILFKDNSVKNISMVDNALIHQNLSRPVKKFYICWVGDEK